MKTKSYALPIAVMFSLLFLIAFVTNLSGSMGVILKNQFGVSNAEAQLGALANFIAYAFWGIPAGKILKNKGYKFTSLMAVIIGTVGVAIQLLSGAAESMEVYIAGSFVSGFSMCTLNVVCMPMLNTLGGGGKKGNSLVQFGNAFNSMGATITPILVGYMIGDFVDADISDAYPVMAIAMAVFVLAFIVIFFTDIPEPHMLTPEQKAAQKNAPKDTHSPLSFRHFVLGAVAIFCYVGIENGIPNTANLYISEQAGADVAGTLIGGYWLLMLCGRLLGAALGTKITSRDMLLFVCALGISLVLCVIVVPYIAPEVYISAFDEKIPLSMIFIPLCGIATSIMFGAIFNLATEGLGKYTPEASGIYMALVCGGGIIPVLQNLLADAVGYTLSYTLVIACLLYMLYFAAAGYKNVNTDIKTD